MKNLCPVEAFPLPASMQLRKLSTKRRPCWRLLSQKSLTLPSIINSCINSQIRAIALICPGKQITSSQPFVFPIAYLFFREMQISSRFCAPSGPMGLPPVVMPHPARILIISSICPWDNNVFFPKIKLFIIRIFA